MTPSDPIQPTDDPPAKTPGELECVECGKALVWKGNGRKPLYCDEHRPRSGKKPAVTSGRESKDDRLRKELASTFTLIGGGVMMVNQYDGYVVIDRADATADALMAAAANNPKLKKMLEQMLEVSMWAALATAVAGIAAPIAANHGLLPLPSELMEKQFLTEAGQQAIQKFKPEANRGKV